MDIDLKKIIAEQVAEKIGDKTLGDDIQIEDFFDPLFKNSPRSCRSRNDLRGTPFGSPHSTHNEMHILGKAFAGEANWK